MKAIALAVAALLIACSPAGAHSFRLGELFVAHPWSRPAALGMTGAGYLSVNNSGDTDDMLVAVETPAAARVEIHQGSTAGGVMRMKKVRALTVPAHGKLVLEPGGAHLMLIKLKRPLGIGDKIPATLVFKKAGRLDVHLLVQGGMKSKGPIEKGAHAH